MQTTTAIDNVKKVDRVLYWENHSGINQLREEHKIKAAEIRRGVCDTAQALNELYAKFKFKSVTDVPADPKAYAITLTLQNNSKLATLAENFKIEALQIDIPQWIQEQRDAMQKWNMSKERHLRFIGYVDQVNELFQVNTEKVEKEIADDHARVENIIDTNTDYRKYFVGEEIQRLEICKRWIKLLQDSGINFPEHFGQPGKVYALPFIRSLHGRYLPNYEYVTTGSMEIKGVQSFFVSPGYILEQMTF